MPANKDDLHQGNPAISINLGAFRHEAPVNDRVHGQSHAKTSI